MDFRRLRSFVQIAEHRSISRAAAAAGLAQPALSQQLAALEQDLKVKLVERSTTGVRLTPEGEILYGRAQIILRQVEEVRADLRSPTHRLAGPVAIGLPPSLSESLTVPLLLALCRDHPDLRPQVIEEGSPFLEELLAKGGLEVAVLAKRPDREGIESERLITEPLLLAAPAAWKLSPATSLETLSKLPWVGTRRTHSVRLLVEAIFAQAGLEHRVVAEIDSLTTVVRCVQQGLGVAVFPQSVAEHAARTGAVDLLPFGATPVMRHMFLSWRHGGARRTQVALELIRALGRGLEIAVP
jgi:LysR family nitrogen assimilation transcriptional regulator